MRTPEEIKEKTRIRCRKWYYEKGKTSPERVEYIRQWKLKNKEKCSKHFMDWYNNKGKYDEVQKFKNKTRYKTKQAVNKGELVREGCRVCGEKAEMHHKDYNDHLDILWLCKKHHEKEHHPENNNMT